MRCGGRPWGGVGMPAAPSPNLGPPAPQVHRVGTRGVPGGLRKVRPPHVTGQSHGRGSVTGAWAAGQILPDPSRGAPECLRAGGQDWGLHLRTGALGAGDSPSRATLSLRRAGARAVPTRASRSRPQDAERRPLPPPPPAPAALGAAATGSPNAGAGAAERRAAGGAVRPGPGRTAGRAATAIGSRRRPPPLPIGRRAAPLLRHGPGGGTLRGTRGKLRRNLRAPGGGVRREKPGTGRSWEGGARWRRGESAGAWSWV